MKPNDKNAKLPLEQRPFCVLIISGSNKRQYNCPGVDSKFRKMSMQTVVVMDINCMNYEYHQTHF